ncbi:MAG TPA: NrfD/PsrC family molybdoenzyme membrane anchor subunit, partial [Rugosimonospora sp.]|nr:NrfD/PsrC family molybdoenzyme membrane anchor subunit [Rugosimonospora sp.]
MTTSGQRADTGTRPDTGAPAGEGTRADTDVRADGLARPGRQAVPGTAGRRWGKRRRGERLMVPKAEFRSYYGLPVLNKPTWQARDIAGYLFLGGLAGASSTLAAAATLTGRPRLARAGTTAAALALGGSLYALVHDLGRPARFLNMLRVFKPTSPMSMGSWLLAGYGGPVAVAAASTLTGRLPGLGRAATVGAGMLGAGVATYTGALIADTAVPLWHEGHRELPVLFAGSAAASAAGFAMVATPLAEA